jgi:signal transduction histidine kinase/CheY-like chemotaxis protein
MENGHNGRPAKTDMVSSMTPEIAQAKGESRAVQVVAAQVRMLYCNVKVAAGVTTVAALVLSRLQWNTVAHPIIVGWCVYMLLVSVWRCLVAVQYGRSEPAIAAVSRWRNIFAMGAGLAGAGWGAAGVLLYPEDRLANQVFLLFIVGGMMLGAATILAARPEAYIAFLIPAGIGPVAKLAFQGDETHLFMSVMACVFTVAMLVTTRRIDQTIASSLNLQFENAALIKSLEAARRSAEALNERLEIRVEERTAELNRSSEQLRAEIARREQMEEELLRARKLESLGVLAGGIAHDFNNFLAVVQGNVELARSALASDSPVQATLDETAKACKRAAFLSSQLLTFSKGGAPVRRLVSVAHLIRDAIPLARAGTQTRFDLRIANDLRYAEVDPNQIGQVLHNILLNARQAMSDRGAIEVAAENLDRTTPDGIQPGVRIAIRDQGPGIPDDVLPRIFDPYFTTKPGGNGLGLATAYAIVAKHGGALSVESQAGFGSVFAIELPASVEIPVPEPVVVQRKEPGTERILVMDDEEALRKLVTAVLGNLGYDVQTAADGAEAVACFEDARAAGRGFAAIVLDLTVSGGMGGQEAAARLKALDPSIKLIVSSGYSDAPVLSDLGKYGFDDVIPKPWTVAQVSEVLRRVLSPVSDRRPD